MVSYMLLMSEPLHCGDHCVLISLLKVDQKHCSLIASPCNAVLLLRAFLLLGAAAALPVITHVGTPGCTFLRQQSTGKHMPGSMNDACPG